MRASIIIASYNEGERLLKTIESCLKTIDELDCEIVAADDGSDDGSIEEATRCFPRIVIATHESGARKGTSPTKDIGARRSKGDVFVFLDAHCKPEGDAIERLVRDVEATNGQAIVMPRIAVLDAERWENNLKHAGNGYRVDLETFTTGWVNLERMRAYGTSGLFESPGLIACCAAMSRSLYETLRGFDAGLGSWGLEDLDLGVKSWLMGYPVLHDPEPVIGHRFQASFTNYSVPVENVAANELRIARKHFNDENWNEWRRRARERRLDWPWEIAEAIFERARESLEIEREYLLKHRKHDEYWYASTFGLAWPIGGPWREASPRDMSMNPTRTTPPPIVSLVDDPRELFLEHYRAPRNRVALANADAIGRARSPSGARLTIYLRLGTNGRIERATFQSERCGVAVAYASLLVEMIQGKSVSETRGVSPKDLANRFGPDAAALDSAALAVAALNLALDDLAKNRS